jgi:N-acetylmuramoyl-L-alanine amidase
MRELTVTDDQLYTVRWAINNGRIDQALGVLGTMLGEAAPEELPTDVLARPERLRVALVVGHNSLRQGATARGALGGVSEFGLNNQVADYLVGVSPPGFEFRKFNRRNVGSYNREIAAVYSRVSAWEPDLALELHFNAGGGDYTFQLAARGAPTSQTIARRLSAVFAGGLGVRDKGVKICGRGDRGGGSLYAVKAPTVLCEPFFGDRAEHQAKVAEIGVAGLAALYLQGLEAAADLLN